jgi:2-polyprenyl-6-methoxyphenol hydroxylase-like FAD-dependent oxidoreductase
MVQLQAIRSGIKISSTARISQEHVRKSHQALLPATVLPNHQNHHFNASITPITMPAPSLLIIGGGVAGNALASLLLLLPLPITSLPHITVLERSSANCSYGQNIDVRGTGIEILRKLGVEEQVRAATTGEEGVMIVDEKNRVWAQMAADKTGRVQTGTSDVEILRGRLTEILRKRAEELSARVKACGGEGIEFVNRDCLESLEQDADKVRVVFANSGEKRCYDLVVGADGLQSLTRRMVWGSEGEEERTKRIGAYGGFFSMPKGETDSLWRRWYHAPGKLGIMVRPSDKPDRSTVFMIVVNDKDARFREVAKVGGRSVAGQKELLGEYFQNAGWESERIVTEMKAADDFYYDVLAQIKMDSWSKGRVVLLGDAG